MLEYAGSQDKNDSFHTGNSNVDGYLYDIKILSFEDLHKREFVSVPLWDSLYCESMRIG